VNNDWSAEAWLKSVFLPNEILVVHIVLLEDLLAKFSAFRDRLLFMNLHLLLSCGGGLVLKIESNWLLEIALNSTALVLTPKSI